MIDFKGEKDLRIVISDFIYSQLKDSNESQRETKTETVYSLSEETIERLKKNLEEDIRILSSN